MDTSSTRPSLSNTQSGAARADVPQIGEIHDLGTYMVVKRAVDIFSSLLLLVISGPFLAIIALLVRLDSRGPVIFRQQRVGRHGEPFIVYKVRTMDVGTPTLATDDLKRSGRSYYTKAGVILRRFSLDELPQLWNVLVGDMSLIGPRPALPSQQWLNTQRQLFKVDNLRPGITGWAQVSGRDELSDSEKVAFDADYRARCSFLMDCRIAFMTVRAVFTGDGAN